MKHLRVGEVTIDRLVELEGPGYEPTFFFPDATMAGFEGEMGWLLPHFWDSAANTFLRSIQSYVVRTGHHTILVDSCVGQGKERPSTPAWDRLDSTWLDQLIAAGVRPEEIDYVLCTHLHADHIGWNTRLENGSWVPTFPNAKYVFHKDEFRYWEEHGKDWVGSGSLDGGFEDSVLPVMRAGQVALVDNDFAIDDQVTLEPTPGHSPGHVCIDVRSSAGHVVLSGDVVHHPIQIAYPEWNSRFCVDPDQSRASRKKFVDRHADQDTLILPAHFASPAAGRIVANGERCKFQVIDGVD
jgi:glyoxylase-like metal-dependent hydrolase (beta-lactamase superfamily II)